MAEYIILMIASIAISFTVFRVKIRQSSHKNRYDMMYDKKHRDMLAKKKAEAERRKKIAERQDSYINAPIATYLTGSQKLYEIQGTGELLISYCLAAAKRKAQKGKGKRYTAQTAPLARKIFIGPQAQAI